MIEFKSHAVVAKVIYLREALMTFNTVDAEVILLVKTPL